MSKINVGELDFKKFLESGSLYVDKTLFIKEFIEEAARINLITRPRRFGKTLNMSMLKYFFDDKNKEENKKLFDGLNISKEKELCEKHQNQYPVIFISLKDCKAKDWTDCFKKIKNLIRLMYQEHSYLKDKLSGVDADEFNSILEKRAEDSDYDSALSKLIRYIKISLDKEVIVLIDEYDAPIQHAYSKDKEYFDKTVSFFRYFLSSALKSNIGGVYKALLTGILRVSKENMFSGLNNHPFASLRQTLLF